MMWPAFAVWWEGKILTNGSFERWAKSSSAKKTHSSLTLRRRRGRRATLHPTQSNPFIYFFASSSSSSTGPLGTLFSVLHFLSSPLPYPSVQLTDHISTDLPFHSRADLHFIHLLLFLSQAVPVNSFTSCFVRCNFALSLSSCPVSSLTLTDCPFADSLYLFPASLDIHIHLVSYPSLTLLALMKAYQVTLNQA